MRGWTALLDGMLSLVFPPRCEVCRALQEPVVCAACRARFTSISPPSCRQCGLPFDPLAQAPELCAECRTSPPPFTRAAVAGIYDDALRQAIHLFKYDGVRALATPLARFVTDAVAMPEGLDCLCPVPLHPARLRMRGYNQSSLLAHALAEIWGLPVEEHLLVRAQYTPPQMSLPAAERRTNVLGAFHTEATLRDRCIGLVDDVMTTGSTLRECSRVLKRARACDVVVITIARAVPHPLLPDAGRDAPS